MSPVDIIAGAYVAYGVYRGIRRGLAEESYRLIRLAGALGASCGLYGWVSHAIEGLLVRTAGFECNAGSRCMSL